MRSRLRLYFLNVREHVSIDWTCTIHSGTVIKIWKGGEISIGSNTEIMHGTVILTYGGKVTIGSNCSLNPYCLLYGHGGLTIGNNVLIAGGTMLIPNHHNYESIDTPINSQGNRSNGIVVEDDVWIGHACSILDGVRIGKGSVIAAGSVVNRDVAPYSVMGGVPAKLVKKRDLI